MRLAIQLGADVPVFVFGQNAFADGVGDQLQAISLPQTYYNVLQPNAFVPTADIFNAEGLTRNTPLIIMTDFADWQTARAKLACRQKNNVLESLPLFGNNDLEAIACEKHKPIANVITGLHDLKLHARMTGSGSCVFVEHCNYDMAARQREQISGKMLHHAHNVQQLVVGHWLVSGLNDHPLRSWLN